MTNGFKGMMIAGALASMLGSGTAMAKAGHTSKEVKCNGTNDCKGKGSCKGASNDCKGQNACKGKSFTHEKSTKTCDAKGGTVAKADENMKKM